MYTEHKFKFYAEAVYGLSGGAVRPSQFKRTAMGEPERKWSAENIVGECVRVPAFCRHVDPQPPIHVDGMEPAHWMDRLKEIARAATAATVKYCRKGKVFHRKRKKNTPIVLIAIASFPGDVATAMSSPVRERWQALVIDAARTRWGDCYRGALAHIDESRYHLHIWVDADGGAVKTLHAGHRESLAVTAAKGPRKEAGKAYKTGCQSAQQWFHAEVGEKLGWKLTPDSPRPRKRRAVYLAEMAAKLETQATQLDERQRRLEANEADVDERRRKLTRENAALNERLKNLAAREAALNEKLAEAEAVEATLTAKRKQIALREMDVDRAAIEVAETARILDAKSIELAAREGMLAQMRSAIRDQIALEERIQEFHGPKN